MIGGINSVLLLPSDIGFYRRRNVCRWVIERLAEHFFAVYDIPGDHYGYGGTDWAVCDSPAPDICNYRCGATLADNTSTAATLRADFQPDDPIIEEACRGGMNDFRQIKGITPERMKALHREHLAFSKAHIQSSGIVMTHFAPYERWISPDYGTSEQSDYCSSDLEDGILRKRPALWLHGHIHPERRSNRRDARNLQFGRIREGGDHDPRLIIELP